MDDPIGLWLDASEPTILAALLLLRIGKARDDRLSISNDRSDSLKPL